MFHRFVSIMNPNKHGFVFNNSLDDRWSFRDALVSPSFLVFDTFGDGVIAHTPNRPVRPELLADYLLSLGDAMLNNDELAEAVRVELVITPYRDDIAFAASVKHTEADETCAARKRRYFSSSEKKISRSPEKEHDKRYQRIESWCDGSPSAINRIILPEYASGIQRYLYADAIRRWLDETESDRKVRIFMPYPAIFIGWMRDEQHDECREIEHALTACQNICRSNLARRNAVSTIESMKRNAARRVKEAA